MEGESAESAGRLILGEAGTVVAPSILSADFGALDDAVDSVARDADWVHVDVMDGHFVPNLTIGPPVVAALRRHTSMYLDCHLMMTNPGDFLEAFRDAGADGCTVHVEVGATAALGKRIKELGMHSGLAVNPETGFEDVEEYVELFDLLLVMTVHPGFGGQQFMRSVVDKICTARDFVDRHGLDVVIEVDGGIDARTVEEVAGAGARAFVSGSGVFGEPDPGRACRTLRERALAALAAEGPR